MEKSKQLALGLIFGLSPTHTIIKDLLEDAEVVARAESVLLDKDDFLSASVNGKSFFELKEVWANMDSAVRKMRERGVDIRGSDFAATEVGTKSVIRIAFDLDVMNMAFTPVIWEGQIKEMLDAWYALDINSAKKDKCDFVHVQMQIAEAMGQTCRPWQLKKMGVTVSDIRSAVSTGQYASLNEKMAAHGDHFRREDVFILDSSGDHTLDNGSGWTHFGALWDELARHGERLEVEDFLFKCAQRGSILKKAEDCSDGLKELFKARLWYGRTEDMIKLHGMMTFTSRSKVSLPQLLDEIADHDYGSGFNYQEIADHRDLVRPLNTQDEGRSDFHPIRPLALKTVWDNIAGVQDSLRRHGQSVTLDDLRQKTGFKEEMCLFYPARNGNFDKVMDIIHESGEGLSVEDLTAKDRDGKTVIDHLLKNDQLAQIMQPRDWLGRGSELTKLWQAMPDRARDKVNFQELVGTINTIGLRQRFAHRLPGPSGP